MAQKNTISKGSYIFEHICWVLISLIWCNGILFRSIAGLTYNQSRLVLLELLAITVSLGIGATWKKRRNHVSLFANIIIPYEIYLLIAYRETASTLCLILAGVSLSISAVYIWMVFQPKIKAKAPKAVIMRRRLIRSIFGVRTIAAFCLTILVLAISVSSLFGCVLFSPTVVAEIQNGKEEITIAEHIDVIGQLDEEVWGTLPLHEKLNTLQTAANIEASYLGLPHELNVIVGNLSEHTLACYNDTTHVVTIDLDHLERDPAHEVLDSLCHEARHAYQHRLCDLYDDVGEDHKALLLFYNIPAYQSEFSSYNSGEDDILGYYFQQCETDARAYARQSVVDYYSKIDSYIAERNG